MKLKTLFIAALLSFVALTGCNNKKGSDSQKDSTSEVKPHKNHVMDQYGFCAEGGEYLGETLKEGENKFTITDENRQLFFRVPLKEGHYFFEPEITKDTTAEASSSLMYYVLDGNIFPVMDFDELFIKNIDTDYIYFILTFKSNGIFGFVLSYSHYHFPDEHGFCVDDGEYVGEQFYLYNHYLISCPKGVAYSYFEFEDNHNYDVLRRDAEIELKYYIKTGEKEFLDVDLNHLVEQEAFAKSTDKKVYVTATYTGQETTQVPGMWIKVIDYYDVDEYGFDKDGVYHGQETDESSVSLFDIGYFDYAVEYTCYARFSISVGERILVNNYDCLQVETYLRNASTKEMEKITVSKDVAVLNKDNEETYEHYLYCVIKVANKKIDVGGVSITRYEHQHEYDEYGFCTICGLFNGTTLTINQALNNINVKKDEAIFFKFNVDPAKKYYRTVANLASSDLKFYAFVDGVLTDVKVNIQSQAVNASEVDDNTYYLRIKPTADVANGSITICEMD